MESPANEWLETKEIKETYRLEARDQSKSASIMIIIIISNSNSNSIMRTDLLLLLLLLPHVDATVFRHQRHHTL